MSHVPRLPSCLSHYRWHPLRPFMAYTSRFPLLAFLFSLSGLSFFTHFFIFLFPLFFSLSPLSPSSLLFPPISASLPPLSLLYLSHIPPSLQPLPLPHLSLLSDKIPLLLHKIPLLTRPVIITPPIKKYTLRICVARCRYLRYLSFSCRARTGFSYGGLRGCRP